MNLDGFCGGMGSGRTVAIDSQECVNFYPEIHAGEISGKSKAPIVLIATPGFKLFTDLKTIITPPLVCDFGWTCDSLDDNSSHIEQSLQYDYGIQFNDQSINYPNPINYNWDFGDGTSYSSAKYEKPPLHSYAFSDGEKTYTITMSFASNDVIYSKSHTITIFYS